MYNLLPLKSKPNQTFVTTVEVDNKNVSYLINLVYRDKIGYWTMDITDYATNVPVLTNIPLLTYSDGVNTFNALRQMAYMHIGTLYVLKKTDTSEDSPSYETLQTDYNVVWGDNL